MITLAIVVTGLFVSGIVALVLIAAITKRPIEISKWKIDYPERKWSSDHPKQKVVSADEARLIKAGEKPVITFDTSRSSDALKN